MEKIKKSWLSDTFSRFEGGAAEPETVIVVAATPDRKLKTAPDFLKNHRPIESGSSPPSTLVDPSLVGLSHGPAKSSVSKNGAHSRHGSGTAPMAGSGAGAVRGNTFKQNAPMNDLTVAPPKPPSLHLG